MLTEPLWNSSTSTLLRMRVPPSVSNEGKFMSLFGSKSLANDTEPLCTSSNAEAGVAPIINRTTATTTAHFFVCFTSTPLKCALNLPPLARALLYPKADGGVKVYPQKNPDFWSLRNIRFVAGIIMGRTEIFLFAAGICFFYKGGMESVGVCLPR